uniref:Uncharacterized protein n=1 Tax=Anopheles culicifacies TaxID=139723 RepID=A0A182LVS6_9DIPT
MSYSQFLVDHVPKLSMDVFRLQNSRTYTLSWWPKINDHVHSLSSIWNTSRLFGAYIVPFNPPTDKPTNMELFTSVAFSALRIYMSYVIITADSWDLLFVSSSPYVEKGLDILLKLPIERIHLQACSEAATYLVIMIQFDVKQ